MSYFPGGAGSLIYLEPLWRVLQMMNILRTNDIDKGYLYNENKQTPAASIALTKV